MRSAGVLSFTLAVISALSSCQGRPVEITSDSSTTNPTNLGNNESVLTRNGSVTWRPLAAVMGGHGSQFHRLDARRTGVDFVVPLDTTHPLKRLYVSGFFCGGVAIGDVDNDDRPDLFLVSGPRQNGLFRQIGDFEFENVTDLAGVGGGDSWGTGAAMVDVDNDGDLDIYVCNYDSPNLLYINQGDARFVESARDFGLDIVDSCVLPTFCDYDGDGDLDCYVLMNRYYRDGGIPRDMKIGMRNGKLFIPEEYRKYYRVARVGNKGELRKIGRPDRLLRNNGDGTFADVSTSAGISRDGGHGLSATWWDYDRDGNYDLYVGNDFHRAAGEEMRKWPLSHFFTSCAMEVITNVKIVVPIAIIVPPSGG